MGDRIVRRFVRVFGLVLATLGAHCSSPSEMPERVSAASGANAPKCTEPVKPSDPAREAVIDSTRDKLVAAIQFYLAGTPYVPALISEMNALECELRARFSNLYPGDNGKAITAQELADYTPYHYVDHALNFALHSLVFLGTLEERDRVCRGASDPLVTKEDLVIAVTNGLYHDYFQDYRALEDSVIPEKEVGYERYLRIKRDRSMAPESDVRDSNEGRSAARARVAAAKVFGRLPNDPELRIDRPIYATQIVSFDATTYYLIQRAFDPNNLQALSAALADFGNGTSRPDILETAPDYNAGVTARAGRVWDDGLRIVREDFWEFYLAASDIFGAARPHDPVEPKDYEYYVRRFKLWTDFQINLVEGRGKFVSDLLGPSGIVFADANEAERNGIPNKLDPGSFPTRPHAIEIIKSAVRDVYPNNAYLVRLLRAEAAPTLALSDRAPVQDWVTPLRAAFASFGFFPGRGVNAPSGIPDSWHRKLN